MIQLSKKIWFILSPRERNRGLILMGLMVLVSFVDLIGVGSIVPFLTVLMNPESIQSNNYLNKVYLFCNFNTDRQFLVFLGVASFIVLVFSSLIRALQVYAQQRYGLMRQHSVGSRILERYLREPYFFFLNRNSSELSKNILSEANRFIQYCLFPVLNILSQSVASLFIIAGLLFFYPVLTFFVVGIFGGAYAGLFFLTKRKLKHLGELSSKSQEQMYRVVSEVFGGVKEFKILGKEAVCYDAFYKPSYEHSHYGAFVGVMGIVPKYFIETAGFGSIIFLALIILWTENSVSGLVPVLGLFAFASYKLLPSLQTIYHSLTSFSYGHAVLELVYDEIVKNNQTNGNDVQRPISFDNTIEFRDVSFCYPNTDRKVLDSVSLKVSKGQSIGFKGVTGSGKSTLVDILIGLLRPTTGSIFLDGVELTEGRTRSWQSRIGYVPQSIFLADRSITENIAFGIKTEDIDIEQVRMAATIACVDKFVNDLPKKYDTLIGDRGIRLSGGQRQRLGIARALYRNPDVLVLDEATSALDADTESTIMQNLNDLSEEKTVFMIAHRISTLEKCDRIYEVNQGKVNS